MKLSERSLLIQNRDVDSDSLKTNGLSLFFTIICIVDVFGVFPIVALPKAIIDCGYYGIILILIVASSQIYTAILLGRCWIIAEQIEPTIRKKNRYPYSALSEFTYGRKLSSLVTILVDFTVFSGGIPNLIVASQNLQLVGLRLTNEHLDISFCYWILILGTILCPILWLGSPKDMKWLCSLSALIVISVFLLVNGSLFYQSEKEVILNESTPKKSTWEFILIAYGIVAFQFDIHPTILNIHVDMKNRKKISKAVIFSFLVSLSMFAVTCINIYLRYGDSLKPSILETLSTTIFSHLASILVAIQLCLTSAISNSALYQHLEESLNISREFNHKRCLLRTMLIILAVLIAESVPRFDIVMSLIGAALISPLVFILPPLFYLKMVKLQQMHDKGVAMERFTKSAYCVEESKIEESQDLNIPSDNELIGFFVKRNGRYCSKKFLEFLICCLIISVSFVCILTSTYLNIIDAIHFGNFSYPCIYNISLLY
ncbi:hypothetical protein WA026_003340 [Henosepilachna vigintioctopunctata]|uniref:Amino acid transporter transmembrane domain-containing protein n=1 Tax=Henosepilachna vigintioctopunctata TaxID=420089 RepID=A0AAW1TMT0_9CUCU